MRSRFSFFLYFSAFLSLAVLALTSVASSQPRLDVFVTPIPNAPFTAVINVDRTVVRHDGSVAELQTTRGIGRDARGRIFNEAWTLVPAGSEAAPQIISVLLYDPQTRTNAMLFPQQRTFTTGIVNRPPATEPPALLSASPTGRGAPSEFTKQEDLGNRQHEGLTVHGMRETQTISADDSGTGKAIVITDEYWYSPDLRINVVIKHDDPRTGSVSLIVTRISRSEPDPALLEIPDGFTPVRTGPNQ